MFNRNGQELIVSGQFFIMGTFILFCVLPSMEYFLKMKTKRTKIANGDAKYLVLMKPIVKSYKNQHQCMTSQITTVTTHTIRREKINKYLLFTQQQYNNERITKRSK